MFSRVLSECGNCRKETEKCTWKSFVKMTGMCILRKMKTDDKTYNKAGGHGTSNTSEKKEGFSLPSRPCLT